MYDGGFHKKNTWNCMQCAQVMSNYIFLTRNVYVITMIASWTTNHYQSTTYLLPLSNRHILVLKIFGKNIYCQDLLNSFLFVANTFVPFHCNFGEWHSQLPNGSSLLPHLPVVQQSKIRFESLATSTLPLTFFQPLPLYLFQEIGSTIISYLYLCQIR